MEACLSFIDAACEEADKIAKYKKPFIFYTSNSLFWSKNKGEIDIKWDLSKKEFEMVDKIFGRIFGSKYSRPKNKNKAIIIKI
jgi:hypothetical protein